MRGEAERGERAQERKSRKPFSVRFAGLQDVILKRHRHIAPLLGTVRMHFY